MQDFPVFTIDKAPEKSKPALQALQGAFGMIPNVAGTMATSPVLIDSLVGLFGKVHGGSFTEAQIQTLLLTNAVTNGSSWAVAFHTGLALKEGLDQADVQAIRERRVPKDAMFAALSTFARTLIEKRGRVDDRDVDAFVTAGFRKEHALEVIAVVAASTITNYTASVTQPPLEQPFQAPFVERLIIGPDFEIMPAPANENSPAARNPAWVPRQTLSLMCLVRLERPPNRRRHAAVIWPDCRST